MSLDTFVVLLLFAFVVVPCICSALVRMTGNDNGDA